MKKYLILIFITGITTWHASAQNQADSGFYQTKESLWLVKKTGAWNVIQTLRPTIDASPITIKGIEAERTMVGAFCMHEVMQPIKGTAMPLFRRLSDLDYNLNDTHWDYISIDTRITGGIMYFTNFGKTGDSIVSYILNFPHPGFGPQQTDRGKNVRVKTAIIFVDDDHDIVKQYWKLTDTHEWLAVQYDYTRKK
ncbi:MAG: DUF1579 family protein [Ginsengibacter sp.]